MALNLSMRSRSAAIHIINPMRNAAGGSENRALNLQRTLRDSARAFLWSDRPPHDHFADEAAITPIDARRLAFPRGGTLVFVGVYFRPGRWIWLARPSRVVIVYNTPDLARLQQTRDRFRRAFGIEPEIVYCSEKMRREAALPGTVETSLFDLSLFAPREEPAPRRADARFTIGRLSRPIPYKHHPDDPAFYRRLAAEGCRVRVMGATDEMIAAGDTPGVEMLPSMAIAAPDFLRSLDCFFYRTAPSWREPWGRVITEAMAVGLPIVAQSGGGYAEIIEHGRNGFLFDTIEEAHAILLALRDDAALRRRVGAAGSETVSRLIAREGRERIVDYYVGTS